MIDLQDILIFCWPFPEHLERQTVTFISQRVYQFKEALRNGKVESGEQNLTKVLTMLGFVQRQIDPSAFW